MLTEFVALIFVVSILNFQGGSQRMLAEETTSEIVREMFQLNTIAAIELSIAILPFMLARGKGHFVVVSSAAGKTASPVQAVYAATKHALQVLSD